VRNDVTNLTAAFRRCVANVVGQDKSRATVITRFFQTQNRQLLWTCDSISTSNSNSTPFKTSRSLDHL